MMGTAALTIKPSSAPCSTVASRSILAGRAVVARHETGRPVPLPLALRHRLFDALVFAKIRARLGGRFRFSVSGGAPLGRDTAEFFWAAGIPVFEGYGLTETSPVISVNHFDAWRLGSVGRVVPGVEVALAPDGEIRVRGPIVTRGYWGKPRETAEVLDPDGWFSTGDIGTLDADGFLFITDRKKELLVNAYGKNVAPAPVEAGLAASPYVASAFAIGDGRPFLSAPSFLASATGPGRDHAIPFGSRRDSSPTSGSGTLAERDRSLERGPAERAAGETVHAPSPRAHPRGGRAHAHAQDQAPGRLPGVRRRDRSDVRGRVA
jgi:acyl-CoA synthetase (AMP-forming)/AMP-acid ligase II